MNNDHCTSCQSYPTEGVMDSTRSVDGGYSIGGRSTYRSTNTQFGTLSISTLLLVAMIFSATEACFPGGRLIRRLPKSEPPLVYKQHVPNVPENSLAASGPREGRIRKFSKRFKELVVNYNPDILFKDEEGTGEDRIMSVRCKEKLDALAMLVMNFWPGVKLRVTEAWDQEGFHAPDSLHYEGRAVDVTTSDRDRNKYGLLARLAAQAGFDWVYYENRMHVHVSVKSDYLTRHKRVLKCFPSHSTVMTEGDGRKSIQDLAIGDRVAVLSRNGHLFPEYEPVIAFLHRNSSTYAEFVEIRTGPDGRVFTASAEHLIYVWSGERNCSNSSFPVAEWSVSTKPVGRIIVGDVVVVSQVINEKPVGMLKLENVLAIRSIIGHGLYAPLTASGTIFVDDVLASCYAAVENEHLAHSSLAPLRLWHTIVRIFWPSSTRFAVQQTDGIHWYAELLLSLADLLDRWGITKIIEVG